MIAFVRLMIHQIVRVDIEKKIAKTLLGIYDKFPNSL